MPYNKEQKIKLLVLYDILCRKTDEEHALNTEDIISELSKLNIELSRKTLPLDIELLNEYGYEVLSYRSDKNYYYVVDRKFENAEATLLSDVIKASKLNLGQKSSLIQKLTEQLGEHKAMSIAENIVNYDMPKHSNSPLFPALIQYLPLSTSVNKYRFCIIRSTTRKIKFIAETENGM
ncbi:MAG: hypothetical protein IJZ83_08680 [Clostridia bacterium]|nr:hypothetical protein [Clostridia bacterium]